MKLLVLLACVAFATAERKRYDGYQVLQVTVQGESQRSVLDQLRSDDEMDFWTERDVMVPPHRLHSVKMLLENAGITFNVAHSNVQDQIDAEFERLKDTRDFDLNDFNTYEDIVSQLGVMASSCDSSLTCNVYSIGQSEVDFLDLWVLSISGGSGRQGHFIDSAIHAREWLAPATVLYIMDHMIRNYGSDPTVTSLIDTYDWYFLPVANPEGYVWSWDQDRLWRKNRAPNDGSNCIGTDLNRNFEVMWSNDGSSDNPCSDTYHGSGPASELETQAMQNEADRLGSSMDSWTSIHCYGNMWMHSWGYTEDGPGQQCARTPDHDDQYQVAEATANAIMATGGETWTYGTICETIYAASGGTVDYTYGTSGIKYSFTPELRGGGFIVPPDEIVPSFEEVWAGINAMVAEIEAIGR